jgi:hypothetical protein
LLLTACSGPDDSASTPSETSSPSAKPDPTVAQVKVTRCSDVRLPQRGLGEADFNSEPETGLLTINFSDKRRGRYRNVTYTVAYRDDPTCVSDKQMAEVIARTAVGR